MEANRYKQVNIIGPKLMLWADREEEEAWTLGIVFCLGRASDSAPLKYVYKERIM